MFIIINNFITQAVHIIWDWPVTLLCLSIGLYLTLRFMFIQVRGLGHSIQILRGKYDEKSGKGQLNAFQALSAALSGTVGLGNIAGVAIAIAIGGPGAIFWMWVAAFFGMGIKFAESTLGAHYREIDPKTGNIYGGPMYYVVKGLGSKWKPIALFFALSFAISAFGIGGMFQANQAAAALHTYFNVPLIITGLLFLIFGGLVILGGVKRIGKVASAIVPIMCIGYLLGALTICFSNWERLPQVFMIILNDAFTGRAAAGGAFLTVLWIGLRRAVFSNEAGLGSTSMVYATVKSKHPIRLGYLALLEPFVDTILICSATAIIIILSGHYGTEMYQPIPDNTISLNGAHRIIDLNNNWQIIDTAPNETNKVQSYRDGNYVLYYKATQKNHTPITLPMLQIAEPIFDKTTGSYKENNIMADGIRFSYYRVKGNMGIKLITGNGKVIATLKLDPSQDSLVRQDLVSGENNTIIHITNYEAQNQWKSAVIHFSPQYKNVAKYTGMSMANMQLMLIPDGPEAEWYIDRIQSVSAIAGVELTCVSFDKFIKGFGSIFVTIAVLFFAFSTLITWSFYGETAIAYVLGTQTIRAYRWLFLTCACLGTMLTLNFVVNLTDLLLGLVIIPNLIVILLLSNRIADWAKQYRKQLKSQQFEK